MASRFFKQCSALHKDSCTPRKRAKDLGTVAHSFSPCPAQHPECTAVLLCRKLCEHILQTGLRMHCMVAPCTMVPLPCSGTSTSWSSWPGAGPLPSSHRFACTAFVPAAFFCSFWLNMRRRRASQSAQRNAAFSHALNSSPPRSAERTTQEPGAPHRGSSDDFLEHLGPKAAGRLTKIEQSTAQHRPLIGGCSA